MSTWGLNPKHLLASVCCFLAPNGRTVSSSTFAEAVRASFVDRGDVFKNINVKFGEKKHTSLLLKLRIPGESILLVNLVGNKDLVSQGFCGQK